MASTDFLSLIYESSLFIKDIRPQVIFDSCKFIQESNDRGLNDYINYVLTEKEFNYVVKEGWGSTLTATLALMAGIIIGNILPTSNPAISARTSIVNIMEGGLSVSQSWDLINKTVQDKYVINNMDWINPYLKNFNLRDVNHQKLIKLIGNTITQDPLLVKNINQMSNQERDNAISNSNSLRTIVLNELGVKQDGDGMSLEELTKALSNVQNNAGLPNNVGAPNTN